MWKLSIEDDQGNKTVVNLVRDEYSLGRSEENTVRLTERNISRRHAALKRNGSGWILEDNQSYNGCFVNGVRVSDPQRLEHGDLVQVGDYRLEITDDAVAGVPANRAATVPAVPRSHALLSQPDRLVMLVGPTPGAEFALAGDRVVIGRGEECDVAINHGSVSRVHAEIQAVGGGRYELVDRESANGIRLNGVELQRGLIDARDTIELGDVVFKFIPAGQIYIPGAEESQQITAVSRAAVERSTPTPGVERGVSSGGLPTGVKVVAALFGMGLLVVLGMVTLRGSGSSDEATAAQPADGAAKVIRDALAMVQQGDVEGAHLKITSEIPEDSNLRQSQEFKDIEARWADMLFDLATTETDPSKRRSLLDRIAKATSVDSVRRKRAANEVEKLDAEGIPLSDLPPSAVPIAKPETSSRPPDLKGGIVRKDPFQTQSTPKQPAVASYPKPAPTPKETASKPTSGGSSPDDLGDRAKLTSFKNSLKAKAASGKASDGDLRMLRALCRQLGDMSCAN